MFIKKGEDLMRRFVFVMPMLILSFSASANLSFIDNSEKKFAFKSFEGHQFTEIFSNDNRKITYGHNLHSEKHFDFITGINMYPIVYVGNPVTFLGQWENLPDPVNWLTFVINDKIPGFIGLSHYSFFTHRNLLNGCVPAIPEPQTLPMMLGGLAVLGLVKRHRQNAT